MAKDEANKVIELLKAQDWAEAGYTHQRNYRIITANSYPLAGAEIKSGGHPRFTKGDWRVSVGKRITYFFKPDKSKPYYQWAGCQFKTSDLCGITDFLKSQK